MTFLKSLSTFQQISSGDWFTNIQDLNSLAGETCGFYTYNAKSKHCTAAFTGLDSFKTNCFEIAKQAPNGLSASDLAGCIGHLHNKTNNKLSPDTEKDLGLVMHLYMLNTLTGQAFMHQQKDVSFSFITILYPEDKNAKKYIVRPFMLGRKGILTVDELSRYALTTMSMDKKGHPEYFKYLPC
jgi:hypothetical protein